MMVGASEDEKEAYRSRLGHFKGMYENNGRQTRSSILDNNNNTASLQEDDDRVIMSRSLPPSNDQVQQKIGCLLNRTDNVKSRLANDGSSVNSHANSRHPSDIELMKEKFAKLLLGEDMSGGGKGVSSALALSNAITNLAASVFGEQKRLEPMSAETKARWRKEIDWLLSVTDHIVEFAPSKQRSKDGSSMEIMTTRQRSDLHINIPALRKLDAMLLDCLDNFKDQNEFYYERQDSKEGKEGRKDDKWWIPTPKVPPNGLSEVTRKWVQCQKDSVNQVLKAAMAINAQVLSEMEIPESYIDALPKNGRATLGDSIYKSITDDFFDPDYFLSSVDMSSEHKIADLKNKIEASVVIWQRKMNSKDSKSSWVSMEKREILEDRAETILLILKHRFPGLPQSDLDINKIEYNKDVGQAILESYSRIIESLAFTVMSRIDDVMQADASARNPSSTEQKRTLLRETPTTPDTAPSHREELDKVNNSGESEAHNSMTLLDFMGWNLENGESETNKDSLNDETETKVMSKVHADKRMSYIEKLENLGGFRSPTARH